MIKNILMLVSFCFFCLSIYKMKKTGTSLFNRVLFALLSLMFLILSAAFIVSDYFTGHGIDESVIYHLKYGLNGAGFMEYWRIIVTAMVILIIGSIYLFRTLYGLKQQPSNRRHSLIYVFLVTSLILNPAAVDLFSLASASYKPDTNFKWYYRAPQITVKPAFRKNIVFIYAESLERTYFDETIFPGLIKGLRKLEASSTYFTGIEGVYSTSWTIAGMTASQCGIPLSTPTGPNSMSGMDNFLKGAVCLGDLLNDEGYRLSHLGGASLEFSGKGDFYSTHGFQNVQGLQQLQPFLKNKSYVNKWGLYDDTLFDIAYTEYERLSAADRPFGLFLLTLDTHAPEGHQSKSCKDIVYKDGSNPMLNAVACSDFLITKFVRKLLDSPQAENTMIVIASDHLALRSTATELLDKGKRRNLFMIIEPGTDKAVEITKRGSTLDLGPTLLNALGYEGRIGLGRNLLSDENSLISELSDFDNVLRAWTPELSSFWEFPKIEDYVEVDIPRKIIKLGSRTFDLPVLMQFNDELETNLGFSLYGSPASSAQSYYGLIWDVYVLPINKAFLWIDECATINKLTNISNDKGYCMMIGKTGINKFISTSIDINAKIKAHDLKKIALLETSDEIYYQNRKRFGKILSGINIVTFEIKH